MCETHAFVVMGCTAPGPPFDGPDGTIWLICRKCGAHGFVQEFSEEERFAACEAWVGPVPWPEEERVFVLGFMETGLSPYARMMQRSKN
jgi:hypothetical protein